MVEARKSGPDIDAVLRLRKELTGESARGVVLVSAAMLEEALREVLLPYLLPNASSNDTLFDGPNAPLSSFSAKIDMAYRLGLTTDRFCRDLHIIRRIRNDVAHRPAGFEFEHASAKERIEALSRSHGIFARSPKWVEKNGAPSLRDQFLEAASWMLFFLTAQRDRTKPVSAREREFGYIYSMDTQDEHAT